MKVSTASVCLLLGALPFVAAGCDDTCSGKPETSCHLATINSCAECIWMDDTCTTQSLCPSVASCSLCRSQGSVCQSFQTSEACLKSNRNDCYVCAWTSSGKCTQSSCDAPCKSYNTKTACTAANSGYCPETCTWVASENKCDGAINVLADAVEDGLKLFVIIIIVICVLVVLGIVACIVCCCCMGAKGSKTQTVVMTTHHEPQQEMGRR